MTEEHAKQRLGSVVALHIIEATCTAKAHPGLKENSRQSIERDRQAAEALGLTDYVNASIGRICGLNCRHCTTPIGQ
jgi:hypothetical protein